MTPALEAGIPLDRHRATKVLRALWLSPLMRQLARVQAEALRARGVEVLLVTTDRHPESDMPRNYELVLDLRFRTLSAWLAAWRRIRVFRPDVVITEQVRDPRWTLLTRGIPRIQLVHDDRRDNGRGQRRALIRALFDRWGSRSAATVAPCRVLDLP